MARQTPASVRVLGNFPGVSAADTHSRGYGEVRPVRGYAEHSVIRRVRKARAGSEPASCNAV